MTSPTESAQKRKVDDWGRVIFPPDALFDLLYRGVEPAVIAAEDCPDIHRYNGICLKKEMPGEQFGSAVPLQTSPRDEQERRQGDWHISGEYATMDVRDAVLDHDRAHRRIRPGAAQPAPP